MLPAIIQNEMGRNSPTSPFKHLSPQTTAGLAALQRSEVAEDLIDFDPDLVLVPVCDRKHQCQALYGKTLDLAAWFKLSPEFTAALSSYQRQPDIDGYSVYRRVH